MAPTKQEKAAWITDISQCMDNVHLMGDGLGMVMPSVSTNLVPQFVKSDPSLFKDDVDIRFSRTLNNCKVPQIRYATPERLLQVSRGDELGWDGMGWNEVIFSFPAETDGPQVPLH